MLLTQCPICDHGNPSGSRFCNACGAPLHLAPCPRCGALNDLSQAACGKCGADLGAVRDRAQPEPPITDPAAVGDLTAVLAQLKETLGRLDHSPTASPPASPPFPATEVRDLSALTPARSSAAPVGRVVVQSEVGERPNRSARKGRAVRIAGVLLLGSIAAVAMYRLVTGSGDRSDVRGSGSSEATAVGTLKRSPPEAEAHGGGDRRPGEGAGTAPVSALPQARTESPTPEADSKLSVSNRGEAPTMASPSVPKPESPGADKRVASAAQEIAPALAGTRRTTRVEPAEGPPSALLRGPTNRETSESGAGARASPPAVRCTEQVAALGLCTAESIQRGE
jgi:hypothetical protein